MEPIHLADTQLRHSTSIQSPSTQARHKLSDTTGGGDVGLQLQYGDILVGPPFPRSGGTSLTSSSLDYTRPVLSAKCLNLGTREEMGRNRNARLTPTQVDVLRKVLHPSLCYPVRRIPLSMQILSSLLTGPLSISPMTPKYRHGPTSM